MSLQLIQVLSNRTGELEDMLFHEQLSNEQLLEAETQWGDIRRTAVGNNGKFPEHYHWDWARKADRLSYLAYRCMGIQNTNGNFEGLIMLCTAKRPAILPPDVGKPMVYIEFLETAPWNIKLLSSFPLYKGIGLRLFEASVLYSIDEGFKGRVGLHSLPQSEWFYRDVCCLTCVIQTDPMVENLPYYEMSSEHAMAFIAGREGNV